MKDLPVELILEIIKLLPGEHDMLSFSKTAKYYGQCYQLIARYVTMNLTSRLALTYGPFNAYCRTVCLDKDPLHDAWSCLSIVRDIEALNKYVPQWETLKYAAMSIHRVNSNDLRIQVIHDHLKIQFIEELNAVLPPIYKIVNVSFGTKTTSHLIFYSIYSVVDNRQQTFRKRLSDLRHFSTYNVVNPSPIISSGSSPYHRFFRQLFVSMDLASYCVSFNWVTLEIFLGHLCDVKANVILSKATPQYTIEPKIFDCDEDASPTDGHITLKYENEVMSVRTSRISLPISVIEFFAHYMTIRSLQVITTCKNVKLGMFVERSLHPIKVQVRSE